jgi:UDP-N-acetylmuramoylalanine--D-glutamate ligase
MVDLIRRKLKGKSLALLGFGREGQANYALLRQTFPEQEITIADANEAVRDHPALAGDVYVKFVTGEGYLRSLAGFDCILRSPGIPLWNVVPVIPAGQITSQTDLFLQAFASQVIGVTGTKGKSTTASLIHHILKEAGRDSLLVGNIGNPAFHVVPLINPETIIVFELSSHQLEYISRSPHTAILLNLFQEHLDAYSSYADYQLAKLNITRFQSAGDCFIWNADDPLVAGHAGQYTGSRRSFPFSVTSGRRPGGFIENGKVVFSDGDADTEVWKLHQDRFLRGEHNLKNILAAAIACRLAGLTPEQIGDGIATFKGLEHRLEYVGEFRGIHFYNDSIATIPEACMEAVRAIPGVDTLIAGGFDRGISYAELAGFLAASDVRTLILVGAAGKRIGEHLSQLPHPRQKLFYINRFDDFLTIALRETRPGKCCLLSPAAASYDEFKNFEDRGKRFRMLVSHG